MKKQKSILDQSPEEIWKEEKRQLLEEIKELQEENKHLEERLMIHELYQRTEEEMLFWTDT